jgi:hypothetical protein
MEPPETIGDPAGTEVILLAQIQDLADDLRRGRARASLRRAWAINEPRLSVALKAPFPLVVGLARDPEVAAGVRHRPVLSRGVLQDL